MAIDDNPRRFILEVTEIDCDLIVGKEKAKKPIDAVEVVFAGHVMPSTKKRLERAFKAGNFKLVDKVLT